MLDQLGEESIMSNNTITITGLVATTPRSITTSEGLQIASFRFATTERRYDRPTEKWIDGDTNWFSVTAFRSLAENIARSVNKGDRLIVEGKLRIRDWTTDDKAGTNVEIDADAIGHDLTWGTSIFTRSASPVSATPDTETTSPAPDTARA
jgi:single-strand DNA-binding protein